MTINDLIIIGGGPAGLCAAINGASEGLSVRMLDNGLTLGGQAKESSAIENYPGFPDGITGDSLMGRMARQARKFAAGVIAPTLASRIEHDEDGNVVVTTDDYTQFVGRTALISIGVSYRRLQADNVGDFIGRGVFYGVPAWKPEKHARTVAVIGGANSAGQAVLGLSKNTRLDVKLLIRKTIGHQMSQYLIDRIADTPNIEVLEACEVTSCHGDECLRQIVGFRHGKEFKLDVDHMYVFIGAVPRTLWLKGVVDCDEHNFVRTDHLDERLAYETSMTNVFAAGDVRSGSTKRIATAIGEGAAALQMIHRRLGDRP